MWLWKTFHVHRKNFQEIIFNWKHCQYKVIMRFNDEIHTLNLMQVLDSKLWFHNWETKIECLEILNWRKRYQLGERLREFKIGLNGVMSCWMSSNVRNYEKMLWPTNLMEAMEGFSNVMQKENSHFWIYFSCPGANGEHSFKWRKFCWRQRAHIIYLK